MLKVKLPQSFSEQVERSIRILTFKPDVLPIGSFMFKAQKFPGDIDIRETIDFCCSEQDAILRISDRIRQKIIDIENTPNIFFSEFKAGLDENLLNEAILADETGATDLAKKLREDATLRWSKAEILVGRKQLSNGVFLPLPTALTDDTVVKLDVYALTGARYVEVSNFMILKFTDLKGNEIFINGTPEDFVKRIKEDIQKFLSEKKFNPFKASKRIWVLANSFGDIKTRNLITELVSSNAGLLYQLITDLETIRMMIKTIQNPPFPQLFNQLSNMKNRFSFINDINLDFKKIYDVIDLIINSGESRERLIQMLLSLEIGLRQILSTVAFDYLIQTNILPLKEIYLP